LCLGEDYEIGENQELVAAAELVDELDLGEDLQIGEGLHLVEVRQNRRRPLYRRGRGPCEAPYVWSKSLIYFIKSPTVTFSPGAKNTRCLTLRYLTGAFCRFPWQRM